MTISPSGVASVCSGDQLELTCNSTGSLLEWQINVTSAARLYRRGITSAGGIDKETYQLQINSTVFVISRITDDDVVPLF